MKKQAYLHYLAGFAGLTLLCACAVQRAPQRSNNVNNKVDDFALGADISWYTQAETQGAKYYNQEGVEGDCNQVMKDCGLNAIRLRVWVDPAGRPRPTWAKEFPNFQPDSWCDANDLLEKCQRAKAKGLDIMVDFHYSDWWADPAKQNVPHQWADHDIDQLCNDVAEHTMQVLNLLKKNHIEPKWVQIGNETTNGMSWPLGKAKADSCQNYARLFKAGYEAMKRVFPNAIGIVHLDNGWKASLYDWNLGGLYENGARWDMVGMSLYPYWAMQSDSTRNADTIITQCMDNIRRIGQQYQCPVMITEIGFEVNEKQPEVMEEGRRQLVRVLRESKYETQGICKGVFYWEPECKPSQYKLGAFTEDGRPTVIMEAWKLFEK